MNSAEAPVFDAVRPSGSFRRLATTGFSSFVPTRGKTLGEIIS
jgi:hypothetical protein